MPVEVECQSESWCAVSSWQWPLAKAGRVGARVMECRKVLKMCGGKRGCERLMMLFSNCRRL